MSLARVSYKQQGVGICGHLAPSLNLHHVLGAHRLGNFSKPAFRPLIQHLLNTEDGEMQNGK